MKLTWTHEALLSLKDIQEYISKDSKYYASLQIEKILAHEENICRYPLSGRIVPEYVDDSIREVFEGNYRIIYKILEQNQIEVLTVVHGARDLSAL